MITTANPLIETLAYETADGSLFLQNATPFSPSTGTIVLKTGPKTYVKLRNLQISFNPSLVTSGLGWMQMGDPLHMYVSRSDYLTAINDHCTHPEKFGPADLTQKAAQKFEKALQEELTAKAFLPLTNKARLKAQMDSSGKLQLVVKYILTEGGTKKLSLVYKAYENVISTVRAKLKIPAAKEDPAIIAKLKSIPYLFKFLTQEGATAIVEMTISHSQNIRKIRMDMPYISDQNLAQLIEQSNTVSPKERKRLCTYMIDIGKVIEAMHKLGFLYNDIKPSNILVDGKEDKALLTDFDNYSSSEEIANSGTFPAPESAPLEPFASGKNNYWEGRPSKENDLWAFGLLLYGLFHGRLALHQTYQACADNGVNEIKRVGSELRKTLKDSNDPIDALILRLLSEKPSERPPMDEVVTILKKIHEISP